MFRCSCKKKKKILSALKIQRQGWELPFCFTFPLFRTLGFSQASTTAHAVCSDKELTLLFLYSSCTVGPESSQPPGQLSSNLHITSSRPASQPSSQTDPALLCSALPRIGCLQESSGLVLFWRAPVPNPSANIRQKLVNL